MSLACRHSRMSSLPRPLGARHDRRDHVVDEGADAEGADVEDQLVGLDLGDVEGVLDEVEEVDGGAADPPEIGEDLRRRGVAVLLVDQLGVADDGVERGAELMAHVGQEGALRPVGGHRVVAGAGQRGGRVRELLTHHVEADREGVDRVVLALVDGDPLGVVEGGEGRDDLDELAELLVGALDPRALGRFAVDEGGGGGLEPLEALTAGLGGRRRIRRVDGGGDAREEALETVVELLIAQLAVAVEGWPSRLLSGIPRHVQTGWRRSP
jgi:hypothetical protein